MKNNYQFFCAAQENYIFSEVNMYLEKFPEEKERLSELFLHFSGEKNKRNIFDRAGFPWHITASGIVVAGVNILVIQHPYIDEWLLPGGHVEMEESARQAAIREVKEETGACSELHEWHKTFSHPLDIDAHLIPANSRKDEPEHWHYDFRYRLNLLTEPCGGSELKYDWKTIDDIFFGGVDRIFCKLTEF